jgi:hypothetical protein
MRVLPGTVRSGALHFYAQPCCPIMSFALSFRFACRLSRSGRGTGRRALQSLRTSSNLWGAELSSQFTIVPRGMAALHTGALLKLHPLMRLIRIRCGLCFPYDANPTGGVRHLRSDQKHEPCGDDSLFSGELALPDWVARISRLIGKSDTTAKRPD